MAAEAPDMRGFVRGLFQGSPDLSALTHAIVRKRYLAHTGQASLTKEEKEQLKLLVEEELVQMKVDDSGSEVMKTEVLASVKPGGHKRPLCVSSSSSDEAQSKQEQKKQRRRKKPDVGSDEDSGIDSKKIPDHDSKKRGGESSETSDQEDLGTETHTDGSRSDGLSSENKRRASPWKARRERQKGSKTAKQKHGGRQEDTSGSESEKDAEGQESDVLEVMEKHRKATKGQKDELESDSEWEFQKKKMVGKEKKKTHAKGEGGTEDARRREKEDDSEEESKTSKGWEILRGKRVDSSGSEEEKKWDSQKRMGDKRGQRLGKAQEGTESEDESGPDLEFKVKEKITNSKRKEESVRIKELGSSSDGSGDRSQMKKGTPKGKTKGVSKTILSHKSESDSDDTRQSKKERIKKTQRKNGSGRGMEKEQEEKKPGIHKPKRTMTGEDSESETDEEEGSKHKSQGKQKACRSEGESTSETEEGGKGKSNCKEGTPSSSESESGPDERESENERRNIGLKEKDDVSKSESSQEEETLKKRGGEKSQRLSKKDSEDSKSKLVGKKKILGQLKKEMEKLRKRVPSKDVSGNESVNEEESSSSGDEDNPTASKQQHQGKGEEHPSIRRLKRYIRECGVHRNYKKLFAGCRSRKAQVEILKKELESLGMKGTPSLSKCKALKQKREEAAEVASLDINNIIATEGRPRRRNVWSLYSKPQDPPSSPEEPPTRRPATDWSRLRGVISSDGESS